MQAIQAKYLPCTNTRGDRVKIWYRGGSRTKQRDYSIEWDVQAYQMARALARELHWIDDYEQMAEGTLPNGDNVYLCV